MHRGLPLLLLICVLFAGLHLGEEAFAHENSIEHLAHAEQAPADDSHAGHPDRSDLAHGAHHHCPVAHEPSPSPTPALTKNGDAELHCPPAAALRSRSWPPPLEPPAA